MQISESIKDLYLRLIAIQRVEEPAPEGEPRIEVDEIVGKLAFLYEKLRNTMDYQEDHLLRRFALERNLKRRFVLETLDPKIARSLIEELMRSGYLPNNSVLESMVPHVEKVIAKYTYLVNLIYEDLKDVALRRKILDWLAGVAACEVDLLFVPELKSDALIESLYSIVRDRIKIKGSALSDREKNIQLYVTLHKELVKSDNPIISYHLLNLYFPDWDNADRSLVEFLASKITSVYQGIEVHLNNTIRLKLAKSLKKQIVVFKVLKELVNKHEADLVGLFANPDHLESEARVIIDKNNATIRRKLRRSTVRAILYIFITKVALALVLEYPYDLYIAGTVNYTALLINMCFPPLLIFFITLSARLPGPSNTKAIISELKNIVYGDPEHDILCQLRVRGRQGPVYFIIGGFFYAALYAVIFGSIIYALDKLHFNILSIGIFLFFVTAVSFFGSRIRQVTKEYSVLTKREGIGVFIITFITLPIIRAGQWLSVNMRRINLFTFILDFIIEAPFKLVVELIEGWFSFIRDKKEEIYKNS